MGKPGNVGGTMILLAIAATVASMAVVAWPEVDVDDPAASDVALPPAAEALRSPPPVPGADRTDAPERGRLHAPLPLLTGHAVAAETGAALSGARWTWSRQGDPEPAARSQHGAELRADLDGAGGVLEVRVEAPGRVPLGCRVDRSSSSSSSSTGSSTDSSTGSSTDVALGTLHLRPGVRLRGTLRSEAGQPVPRAWLRFMLTGPARRSGPALEPTPLPVQTRMDGTFELPWPVAPGRYRITATAAPPLVSEPDLDLPADRGEVVLDLTCAETHAADRIRGTVDTGGRGNLLVELRHPAHPKLSQRVGRDGRFEFFRPPGMPRPDPVRLAVTSFGAGARHEPITVSWGQEDIRLVLDPGRRLRISVTAAGEPVPDFDVRAFPMVGARSSRDSAIRVEARGARDGIGEVQDLRPGLHLVVVHPREESAGRLLTSLPVPYQVPADADGELQVELRRAAPLAVRVVRPGGAPAGSSPVIGSTVELFALQGLDAMAPGTVTTELDHCFERGATRGGLAILLGQATTGADGVAYLSWYPSDAPLTLRVRGRHPDWQQDGLLFEREGQELRVEVAAGAELTGRLSPAGHRQWLHRVSAAERERIAFVASQQGRAAAAELWRQWGSGLVLVAAVPAADPGAEPARLPRHPRHRFPIDDGGQFGIPGIPAGRWRVLLERRNGDGHFEEIGPLAEVELRDGEKRELDLDLRGLVEPSSVGGVLRWNGRTLGGALVRITWLRRDGVICTAARTRTDATGAFRITDLAPRAYLLAVRLEDMEVPLGGRFELAAGDHHERPYELSTVAVRVKLPRAEPPRAEPPRVVELRDDSGYRFRRRPDAQGEVHWPCLPVGRYRWLDDGTGRAVVFEVRPGPAEQEFTFGQ